MSRPQETVSEVTIRFAGDSGDGMQLLGDQFTQNTALLGNDLATLPDFPAEIRAPAGTREGVSGFQLHFADHDIQTHGDEVDVLVAMNPAALVKNLQSLKAGGVVIVNTDKFKAGDLAKARLDTNPLEDGTLDGYRVVSAPISQLTKETVGPLGLNTKESERCKNFFALGMMYWLYNRDPGNTVRWVEKRFPSPHREANLAALHAGAAFADTVEVFQATYTINKAKFAPGHYKNITGNRGIALGLAAVAQRAGLTVFYGSYPITPASDILHNLAPFKNYGVATFQAEDEIAAVCAAIGASYGGNLGVTGTSGPDIALKAEAIGLAVMTELPLVVIDVQRGGPSTGLPTKTEQADLLQNLYGRNGEAPVPVIAPKSPADCFDTIIEACRIAMTYMVPVVVLSDGYIANGAEPWMIPHADQIPDLRPTFRTDPEGFQPYARDPKTLARPWVRPGTPGLHHRIGGIEKQNLTGNVSYDPANHELMCQLRAEKVRRIQQDIPPTEIHGDPSGTLVLSWGSTWGACRSAVDTCRSQGVAVGHVHLRHIHPFPADLAPILRQYQKVIVPELNLGQLSKLIRAEYLVDAVPLTKIQGQPFATREVVQGILAFANR